MKPINIENFQEYLGRKVEVEICCYSAGMCHPAENVLIDESWNLLFSIR
jgi:hypothetical protein